MKKKILIGITKGTWGGAQKNVYDIATTLSKDDFEISVLTGTPGRLTEKLHAEKFKVHTLKKLGRDVKVFTDLRSFFSLVQLLQREKPNVAHFHSPKMGGLGALAARLAGIKKIIYTPHGWAFYEKRSLLSKSLIYLVSWFTTLLSTNVILFSEEDKIKTIRLFGSEKKFIVIPNGIMCEPFPKKEDSRQALRIPTDGTIHIGTIAELHKNKGLAYALGAFAKLPSSFSLHIIGSGDEEKKLKALANELKITHRVYWHGFIENASAYLKAFDIFLLSSIKEGLPYVLLEAGCAGLPVVATNVGSVSEVIKNNATGIVVKSTDTQALADALLFLGTHETERTKFGENLKHLVEEKYSTHTMVEKLIRLYHS